MLVIATSSYARAAGAAKPVAKGIGAKALAIALGTGVGALALFSLVTGPTTAFIAVLGVMAGHIAARLLFERRLGGYTGDCLGAPGGDRVSEYLATGAAEPSCRFILPFLLHLAKGEQ